MTSKFKEGQIIMLPFEVVEIDEGHSVVGLEPMDIFDPSYDTEEGILWIKEEELFEAVSIEKLQSNSIKRINDLKSQLKKEENLLNQLTGNNNE